MKILFIWHCPCDPYTFSLMLCFLYVAACYYWASANVEYFSHILLDFQSFWSKHFMRRNHRQRSASNPKCIMANNTKLELECSFLPHTCPRFLFRTCWPDSLMSAPSSPIGHLGLLNYFRAVYFMKRNNLESLSYELWGKSADLYIFTFLYVFYFFIRCNKWLPTFTGMMSLCKHLSATATCI